MSDEEESCPECPAGLPGWVATFADLMSLLMCFFVLLLSFSEMDVMKFKRLAGSMAESFGVQNKLKVNDIPKGTSIIAQEFSPGRPEPTPINEIWQKTNDLTEMSLEIDCAEEYDVEQGEEDLEAGSPTSGGEKSQFEELMKELEKQTQQDAIAIAEALSEQITSGDVEVETKGRTITIRIKERGSFSSGSATLKEDYLPILKDIRDLLVERNGLINVNGHTDNIPIRTARFRSNWDLAAGRAVSVAHELLKGGVLDPQRFTVTGFGDTRPLVDNSSRENRSRNRRVEIVISQGEDVELQKGVDDMKQVDPKYYESLDIEPNYDFELNQDEIF